MKTRHTQGEWTLDAFTNEDGSLNAEGAAFIVLACNNFDKLIDLSKELLREYQVALKNNAGLLGVHYTGNSLTYKANELLKSIEQ